MKLRNAALVSAPFLLACIGPFGREDPIVVAPSPGVAPIFDSPADSDHDSDEPDLGLIVADAPDGDVSCFTGSLDHLPAASGTTSAGLTFEEWAGGEPLADAEVTVTADSSSDVQYTDGTGHLPELTLPTCGVVTARSTTVTEEAMPTTAMFSLAPDQTEAVVPWVAKTTYQVIPSLLGIAIEPGTGHVFGQVLDCSGQPLDHVEVRVSGGAEVRYSVDEFPSREQEWTSDDGRFLLVNIDPFEAQVTAYIWKGEAHVAIAQATVTPSEGEVQIIEMGVGLAAPVVPSCD
ncbi:MAG: hypothetical protein GY913_00670 [Proteobacteria bacterium]|nr:hypothetical protein [Pseudomonadota bacterium]MCP4915410.1 hypothetical protein [Pseudomonadota bacterium]